jgi:ATP-dependent DNA helicase RecG
MAGLMLTFRANAAHLEAVGLEPGGGTTPVTTPKAPQETTQERILALMGAEPAITRRKIAERIGITPDGIKYHLERLRAAGVIRHVGPTKAGRWEILK